MEYLCNNSGIPLMAYGQKAFFETVGAPTEAIKKSSTSIERIDNTAIYGGHTAISWGSSNDFPNESLDVIRKTGVLSTGLRFLQRVTLGQGVYPCRVTGYTDAGKEIVEVVNDPKLIQFLQGRTVRRYLANATRDLLKFGSAYAQMIPNQDGSKIIGINDINAMHCRLCVPEKRKIRKMVVHGEMPDVTKLDELEIYEVLDNYDPFDDLNNRRIKSEIAGKNMVWILRDEWDNSDIYPLPIWYTAKMAGWIDIANMIPKFLNKAYLNQITLKYHIKIPYAYWDRRFPIDRYPNTAQRADLIREDMEAVEKSLTSVDNANKAIFTHYDTDAAGKPTEQWVIEDISDNGKSSEDKLITSAAANSEILFSLLVNPNVLGAGMPGGTYAGSTGGSNIREAFLINVALMWLDRQTLLDPLEAMLEYNGIKDVQLRFQSTVLTTLDTGAGTQKTLS